MSRFRSRSAAIMHNLLKIAVLMPLFLGAALIVWHFGSSNAFTMFLSFSICIPILYLITDRFIQQNRFLTMKEEALKAELALLKNQINPHFFFNTLNNLYGLTREKSDLAPTLILKLSELMRFTIYEGRKDHVMLRDEIAYLENYLNIQSIRMQTHQISLKFRKEIEDERVQIPPLLLIMLVENAFKHGVASGPNNPFVNLTIRADKRHVLFEIENNFAPVAKKQEGIGLANMKRRLTLLFPNKHQYTTQRKSDTYRATVRLDL